MDDFDEYFYDYDDHNTSGLLDDDWWIEDEDEQIWLDVKTKFEKYLKDLMEADFYD